MKILYQLALIFSLCFMAVVLEKYLPLPASIISMVMLLLLLILKIVKVESIKEIADFLLNNMAFLFVPALVNIMNYFEILKSSLAPIIFISIITTFITMLVTYYLTSLAKKVIK